MLKPINLYHLLTATILLLIFPPEIRAQIRLPDELREDITSAKYIQRTMHLLKQGDDSVRILVYGQSLSAQDWWLEVKDHLQKEFPGAPLIMTNKAVGGFASQILIRIVERDILDYYPDLVIFHVFGSDTAYENIIRKIRSLTSTEILIWNDPQNQNPPSDWNTLMSYEKIPEFAARYKCAFIDVRTPINELVKKENLSYREEFTKDGTHFNEKGCHLLAGLIIPSLVYDKNFPSDTFGLCKTYKPGVDFQWNNNELVLPFTGNRVDVVLENHAGEFSILIDGKKPSDYQSAWNYTRPGDNGEGGWIWSVGAPVRIRHTQPWIDESFTLTFDSVNYESRYLTFHVEGSECGFDGRGNNREDFLSQSGRVFIEANEVHDSVPGDWHVFRNWEVLKFQIEKGYTTTWKTYLMGMDEYKGLDENDGSKVVNLFKGIPDGEHVLRLVSKSSILPAINEIRVYNPYLNEQED